MSRGSGISCASAAVLVVAGVACKSDEDPGAAFIARYCDVYEPCCMAAGLPTDGAACRALFASASSEQAAYDTVQGEACLEGLQQIAGQAGFCEGDIVPPSACARAFGGAAGSACIQDAECPPTDLGEVHCVSGFVNGAETRRCQVQTRGQAGSTPCVGSVRRGVALYAGGNGDIPGQGYLCHAADGLRCDGTACVALTAPGQPCERTDNCAEADFCDASTGACAARKPISAGCFDQALECQDGAYCDTAGLTCVAQLETGAACTDHGQCLTGNCLGDVCAPTPTGGTNPLCGG